jgi:riboflavin synthase
MFTGLVEEAGVVTAIEQVGHTATLTVRATIVHEDARLGDSIAINGCCLTVIANRDAHLTFEAVPETMARTNLGELVPGARVNLERSMAAGARLGGHFVQGHIDGVGTVVAITPEENAVVMEISMPPELRRYFVEKGSVAVDGVSLTVARVFGDTFTVWTIPHTRAITNLGDRVVGDHVNLECDLLGKYIERLLEARAEAVALENIA